MRTKRRWTTMVCAIALVGLLGIPGASAQLTTGVCYDENGVPYPEDQDTDGDGKPDCNDPDDDNDRLSDALEQKLGLKPLKRDSDGDGVRDTYDLAPTVAGALEITVKIGTLQERGDGTSTCDGDDTPWDPFVRTLFISLPMKTVDYSITQWTNDNHPWDYTGSSLQPKPPQVKTNVPTDVRKWNLIDHGFPFSQSTVEFADEDKYNFDDTVKLSGTSGYLKDDPLSLVDGVLGHANRGKGACSAEIAFKTDVGFDVVPVDIGERIVVYKDYLVECHEVGLSCGGTSATTSTSSAQADEPAEPFDYAVPEVGGGVEDLIPAPTDDGRLRVVVFAEPTLGETLELEQRFTGFDGAGDALGSLSVAPGLGQIVAEVPLTTGEIEWSFPGSALAAGILFVEDDLPHASATLHVLVGLGPAGVPLVLDQALSVGGDA